MKKNSDLQNIIYNLSEIKELRKQSGCLGITYGLSQNQTNPLRGSHVIIITEKLIAIIDKGKAKKAPIYLFQYVKAKTNSIGESLKPCLKKYLPSADINIIRNIPEIKIAYKMASGKGRPYGIDPTSPLFGSHITLIEPEELLIIRQHRKHKRIKLFHYKKGPSNIGEKITKILNYYNFTFLAP